MPRYNDLVNMMEKEASGFLRRSPQTSLCCTSCAVNSIIGDPMTTALLLTIANGWLMANADASEKKRDKFLYYTAAGLVNIYIFKG